jgi:RimJ/RimL family protein N-acetyltransferase
MSPDPAVQTPDWPNELPVLSADGVTLYEPSAQDVAPLVDVLSAPDASRFGIEGPIDDRAVRTLIERLTRDRAAGVGFAYTIAAAFGVAGFVQVRQLNPGFTGAEWDMTLAPAARGTGLFLESARLVGSFAFGSIGVHRLEARVLQSNGRAMGALRKLGAVQEGVLRRSIRRNDTYFDQVLWSILKEDWSDQPASISAHVH